MGTLGASLILFFFYDSLYVLIPGVICGYLFCRYRKSVLKKKRCDRLETEFKEWILLVSSKLKAGYAVENAFIQGGHELANLYGKESDIRREAENLERLVGNNVTIERILSDLGKRSGTENIRDFSDVFAAAKRSGGNLCEIIMATAEIILMKIDTEREIQTMLHGRKSEQRIMCLIPLGMIFYIRVTSPGYFDPLYHNPLGIIVMTICLGLYGISVWMSFRLVTIEA